MRGPLIENGFLMEFSNNSGGDGDHTCSDGSTHVPMPIESSDALIVSKLVGEFRSASHNIGRADRLAHTFSQRLLARIHAACPLVADPDGPARRALIAECTSLPDVAMSVKWNAEKQTPYQLYTTAVLGLTDYRSRKTNWNHALGAAVRLGIRHTEEAFAEFLKKNGGIEGAAALFDASPDEIGTVASGGTETDETSDAELPANKNDERLRSALKTLSSADLQGHPLPLDLPAIELASGIEVLFMRRRENSDGLLERFAIALPVDDRLIVAAAAAITTEADRNEREEKRRAREWESLKKRRTREWRSFMRKKWKEYCKRPNARKTLEFGEYVQEYEGEYIDLKPVELREVVIEW